VLVAVLPVVIAVALVGSAVPAWRSARLPVAGVLCHGRTLCRG
jgi:hypothetical protein